MDSTIKIDDLKRITSCNTQSTPDLLPPCRVCGGKASGIHYGANTCHGCKNFFRRCLLRKGEYICKSKDKRCVITKEVDIKMCPYCRYQRCTEVGMSVQAIRSGRYTASMHARNLLEVRGLDESELSYVATTVSSATVPRNSSHVLSKQLSPLSSNSFSPDSGLGSPSPTPLSLVSDLQFNSPPSILSTSTTDHLSAMSPIASPEDMELDQIIENITACHRKFSLNIHLLENKEELKSQQERYYDLAKLNESVFGKLRALSRDEYRDFFQATGIDIDDRRKRAWELLDLLEQQVTSHVQFAKGIYGFRDLLLADQCKLLKGSIFELRLFDNHGTYNSDLDTHAQPGGITFQPREICYVDDHQMWAEKSEFVKGLNTMDLSFTETAVIKAIILLFSDRLPLGNPADVDNLQVKVINAFRHYLRKTNPNSKRRFTTIWNKIIHVRTFSVMQEDIERKYVIDFPEMKNFPLCYYYMCND